MCILAQVVISQSQFLWITSPTCDFKTVKNNSSWNIAQQSMIQMSQVMRYNNNNNNNNNNAKLWGSFFFKFNLVGFH